MTHLLAYLAGVLTATVALWARARLTSTPEEATVPRDPRLEELAVMAATAWDTVDMGQSEIRRGEQPPTRRAVVDTGLRWN